MLISTVMPFISIYRLPHGQYGYKGRVINLPQDITTFVSRLPRLPSELDILLVRKEGSDNTHCDLRVRKLVVLRALQWLKQHNEFYRNIEISQAALDQLPEDGSLSSLREVEMDVDDELELQTTDDPNIQDSASFVPVVVRKMTEEESIWKSVQERQSAAPKLTTVSWPQVGDSPISEFTTEEYMSCTFPTLLPTGEAEFLSPRQNTVTIGNYFKHLMRDMVGREGELFSNRVLHYAGSLRGTGQYWFKQRSRLISMVDALGLPTVFFTHSTADTQWPELAKLICPKDQHSSSSRTAIADNPAIADWFFAHRIDKFIDAFYVGILGAMDYWFRFEWQHRGSPHIHGIAWFPNAPDVEKLLATDDDSDLIAAV